MSSYFFIIMMTFWVLKPLKKSLFIRRYDEIGFDFFSWHMTAAQTEQLAKILNIAVSLAAVIVFTALARRFHRQQLTFIFTIFFMGGFVFFAERITDPQSTEVFTIWAFYLFGDLFSGLMVATFFAFLNDSVSPSAAKRMYGVVGLGGVLGGAAGSMSLRALIKSLPSEQWMWVCFGMGIVILLVAFVAGRVVDSHPEFAPSDEEHRETEAARKGGLANPAIEGAYLVTRSGYFLAIAGIVFLYEIASTCMDFQFTSTIAEFRSGEEIGEQFSTVYLITNSVAVGVQLLLTSFVMTRFGVGVALLVTPIVAFAGSGAFLVAPVLWVGSLLNTADNGFNYSINQSAKESLYVPMKKADKYNGKAFIDLLLQRFAKGVAILVTLAITREFAEFSRVRWLSVFTMVVILAWMFASWYVGKRFREIAEKDEP